MNVEKTNTSTRKLVAVLGTRNGNSGLRGVFLPTINDGLVLLDPKGLVSRYYGVGTMDELLRTESREPVYEGDTITITF